MPRTKPLSPQQRAEKTAYEKKRRAAKSSPETRAKEARERRERRKRPEIREADRQHQRRWRKANPTLNRERSRKSRREYCSDGMEKMYFIQATSGPIKIGFTTKQIRGRLQELQCGNPEELRVLKTIASTREEEYRTHLRFEHLLIRGEWFRPAKDLLTYISTIT